MKSNPTKFEYKVGAEIMIDGQTIGQTSHFQQRGMIITGETRLEPGPTFGSLAPSLAPPFFGPSARDLSQGSTLSRSRRWTRVPPRASSWLTSGGRRSAGGSSRAMHWQARRRERSARSFCVPFARVRARVRARACLCVREAAPVETASGTYRLRWSTVDPLDSRPYPTLQTQRTVWPPA